MEGDGGRGFGEYYWLVGRRAKSEMMVASSVLCDLTPHCFVICDRRDRGVDSILYTVHASKHGRKRRDVAFFYSFNQ